MSDPFPSWDAPGPYARQRALEPTEELPVVRVRRRYWPPVAAFLGALAVAAVLGLTLAGAHHGLPPAAPGSSTATATTLVWLRGVVTLPPAPPVVLTTAALVVHTHAPVVRHTRAPAATPAATPAASPTPAATAAPATPPSPVASQGPGTVGASGAAPTIGPTGGAS